MTIPRSVQKLFQSAALKQMFAQFGRQGGRARARRMSKTERQDAARHAAQARWARSKAKKASNSG